MDSCTANYNTTSNLSYYTSPIIKYHILSYSLHTVPDLDGTRLYYLATLQMPFFVNKNPGAFSQYLRLRRRDLDIYNIVSLSVYPSNHIFKFG